MRIYTVGHSNLDFDDFTAMLSAAGVESVVDVRKLPGSRKYPWFNDDHLAAHLPTRGIAYSRSEGLTGRRNVSRTVPFEVNGNWRNRSFHNYADHALGDEFARALAKLRDQAAGPPHCGDVLRGSVVALPPPHHRRPPHRPRGRGGPHYGDDGGGGVDK